MKNASQLSRSFLLRQQHWNNDEREWVRAVYGAILIVCRRNREFTVDDIWEQIDILASKDKLPKSRIDHRILGPMLRHMVVEGMLGSTGYYTKSTRSGGGSRPVTIWESYSYNRTKAAA